MRWFSNYISLKTIIFYLVKSVEREAGVKPKRKLAVPVAVPDRLASKKGKKKVEESDTDSSSGEFRVMIII